MKPASSNPAAGGTLKAYLLWLMLALLLLAVFGLAELKPFFAAMFPELERPMYEQDSFSSLMLAHLKLVGLSSTLAIIAGMGAGIFATRKTGLEFRPLVETLASAGQTFPPVAVLAVAVPLIGFGETPALIALALYGLLPVLQATLAGIGSVPQALKETAEGLGMNQSRRLMQIELPLAAPVILAGIRTSVIVNIGTAAIASTVGAKTLGLPIIVGLSGFNTAYVMQGAVLVGLLAVTTDLAFEKLAGHLKSWQFET